MPDLLPEVVQEQRITLLQIRVTHRKQSARHTLLAPPSLWSTVAMPRHLALHDRAGVLDAESQSGVKAGRKIPEAGVDVGPWMIPLVGLVVGLPALLRRIDILA